MQMQMQMQKKRLASCNYYGNIDNYVCKNTRFSQHFGFVAGSARDGEVNLDTATFQGCDPL